MTNGAKKKVDAEKLREEDDLREVLRTRKGRRFLWRLLSSCGVFKTTFTGNRQGDFLEGRRSVGTSLIKDICDIGASHFATLMSEAEKEAK